MRRIVVAVFCGDDDVLEDEGGGDGDAGDAGG